jgi:anti-sigma factor RsiW
MTDARRWELERYFDGELPEPHRGRVRRSLAAEAEAQRYLHQLRQLRSLAQCGRAIDPFSAPLRRWHRVRWALAASAAIVACGLALRAERGSPRGEPSDVSSPTPRVSARLEMLAEIEPGPTSEVELFRWANQSRRRPDGPARFVLAPLSRTRKRSPAREILALELANAPPGSAAGLQKVAVLHRAAFRARARPNRVETRPPVDQGPNA